MPKTRAVTLSSLVCLLVERFLPDAQQRYVLPNLKCSEWFRQYSDFVPDFLRERPRSVILHCLDRQSRSSKYCSDDVQAGEKEGLFAVRKSDGSQHVVDFIGDPVLQMPSCSCKDWIKWNIPCKHFFAVFRYNSAWNWESLPEAYKNSAYLTTDIKSTNAYFLQFSKELPNSSTAVQDIDTEPLSRPISTAQQDEGHSPVHAVQQEIPTKVRTIVCIQ